VHGRLTRAYGRRVLEMEQRGGAPIGALAPLARRARSLADDAEIAGAALRVTSSAKLSRRLGGEVLWIVGAGSEADGGRTRGEGALGGLRLDRVHAAMVGGELDDEPHVPALAHRLAGSRVRMCPPETLLHAVVPATHVDVTQPDAVMALCDAAGGERLAQACFAETAAWLPYEMSGAALARELGRAAATPGVRLALLARRGLVTWAETPEACHAATVAAVVLARAFLAAAGDAPCRGGTALAPLRTRERARLLARLLPVVRSALGSRRPKVVEVDTTPAVLDFVCTRDAPTLAKAGPVCPQQVAHTQRAPLWIDLDPRCDDAGDLAERVVRGARRHRAQVRWEAAAFGGCEGTTLDPDARVVLIAGVGMVAAGATRTEAHRARCAYGRAIRALSAATALDRFVAPNVPECCAFERALAGNLT